MNHFRTLLGKRALSSSLFCGSVIHSFFLFSSFAKTFTQYRHLSKSLTTNSSSSPLPAPSPKLNPPASTRPTALTLPERKPSSSMIGHLFETGKAYIKFYKTGLSAVFANRRYLQDIVASKSASVEGFRPPSIFNPGLIPRGFSRADWVLLWRVRHDILRVPLFSLVLLVCWELAPLVVLLIDGVVPYTCRLPRQISTSLVQAEERRRKSFLDLERAAPHGVLPSTAQVAARKHVLRSLHLSGIMWDKIGFIPPGMWTTKGRLRMAFIEGDDMLLARDGRAADLEEPEVWIACADRGIDCVDREVGELRQLLDEWLRLTGAEESTERRQRLTVLLTTR